MRRARVLVALVGAVAVIGVASLALLWRQADGRIARLQLPALESRAESATPPDGAAPRLTNILVVGADAQMTSLEGEASDLVDTDAAEVAPSDAVTPIPLVADSVLLVQIASTRERPTIVNFPHDLKVEVSGFGTDRIGAVLGLGGPNLLVEVIEDYTGLELDHYVEVWVPGMAGLVDAIGGVVVCLDAPLVDPVTAVDVPAGCQVLDGVAATGLVRSRAAVEQFGPADDFGRIARQQYVVAQAMRQLTARGLAFNPFRLKSTIDAVAGSLATDDGLGARSMLRFASTLRDLDADAVDTRAIPGYWSSETGYVHAHPEQAEVLLQALRTGEPMPPVGATAPDELLPADVRVMVLNGEGSEGLAGDVAALVEAEGFRVVGTDNAADFDVQASRIEVTADKEPLARLLAARLPGVAVVIVPAIGVDADVVLIVGADRLGVPANR